MRALPIKFWLRIEHSAVDDVPQRERVSVVEGQIGMHGLVPKNANRDNAYGGSQMLLDIQSAAWKSRSFSKI